MKRIFLSLTLICVIGHVADARKVIVKGSGGVVSGPDKTTYCPNESDKTCAIIKGPAVAVNVGDYVELVDEQDNPIGEGVISYLPETTIDENGDMIVGSGLELISEE